MTRQERHDIAMVLNFVALAQVGSKTVKDYEKNLAYINNRLQKILHGEETP